jgi:DNA-binding PadR family transcriptional regulator
MRREKLLPLTETAYYILLALLEPAHGYAVMQKIEALSEGQVRIAAGTLYGAFENLAGKRLIGPVKSDDPRRKNYETTGKGRRILMEDCRRMEHMVALTRGAMKEEKA